MSVPTSQIDWVAETLIVMMANGAKPPFVVSEEEDGRLYIVEAERHPSRWTNEEWERADRARSLSSLMEAWQALHTAAAGDPESDPNRVAELRKARERFTDAANDFCVEMDKRK